MIRGSRIVFASACFAALLAVPASAQVITVPVPPAVSFLHVDPTDFPPNAAPIDLASLGLTPGSVIRLQAAGDWDNGPGGDVHPHQVAVFSASATLLPGSERYRVPDAIDIGIRNFDGVTCPNADSMDIVQDFRLDTAGVVVTIPVGATHLFTMPLDCFSMDNSDPDGDCALRITVISLAGVEAGPASRAPMAFPNPFAAATAIRFDLAATGPVRVAVHDVTGRRVRTLASGTFSPGAHEVRWDGLDDARRPAPNGTYFVRLEDGLGARTVRVSALR